MTAIIPEGFTEPESVLGVVSHDAGGAEVLLQFLKSARHSRVLFAADGPARDIFGKGIEGCRFEPVTSVISEADWVITGTGWQSDFEWGAILSARRAGKRVVSFLDNWVNYESRFIRNGQRVLPDELWVADTRALKLAQLSFPDSIVRLCPLPEIYESVIDQYQELVRRGVSPIRSSILFLSDNIEEACLTQGTTPKYSDAGSLTNLLDALEALKRLDMPITIRPHPSEAKQPWLQVVSSSPGQLSMSRNKSLVEDLATHEIVVGSNSIAMIHAVRCGKRVICAIRSGETEPDIPLAGIQMLEDIRSF